MREMREPRHVTKMFKSRKKGFVTRTVQSSQRITIHIQI